VVADQLTHRPLGHIVNLCEVFLAASPKLGEGYAAPLIAQMLNALASAAGSNAAGQA